MNERPLISVCLPVYNGTDYLAEAIASILAQDYPRFEVLVQDDASTDRTPEILAGRADPRVRAERNPRNLGIVRSLNRAFERANGEYFRILCHDDRMLPGDLAVMAGFLTAHPEAGMCFSRFFWIDGAGNRIGPSARIPELPPGGDRAVDSTTAAELFFKYGCLPGNLSTVTITRAAYAACGGFDERLLQAFDWELWIRISRRFAVGLIEAELCEIRFHPGQYSKYAHQTARIREIYQMLELLEPRLPARYLAPRGSYRRHVYARQYFRTAAALLAAGRFRPGLAILGEIARRDNPALLLPAYLGHAARRLIARRRGEPAEAVLIDAPPAVDDTDRSSPSRR